MKFLPKVALSLTAVAVLAGCGQEPEVADKTPRPVKIVTLQETDGQQLQRFAGVVRSANQADLAFRVPGTLEAVLVKAGDMVSKGQVLARLDPHDYQVALLELEARLLEAESAQRLANIELKRLQRAQQESAIAEVNIDRARSGVERAGAGVKVVKQNIQKAKDALAYTELKAPYDGVISEQHLQAFEQAVPGLRAFSLHQPDAMDVIIDVPASLIHKVHIGQRASIKVDGSESALTAQLRELSTQPDLIKQTYQAKLGLQGELPSLVPGQTADVNVELAAVEQVHCLPYSAVLPHEKGMLVFKAVKQHAEPVAVSLQSTQANTVCVKGDLQTGDSVIVAGSAFLTPQQPIGELIEAAPDA